MQPELLQSQRMQGPGAGSDSMLGCCRESRVVVRSCTHRWANSTATRWAPMKERLKYLTAACASATVR